MAAGSTQRGSCHTGSHRGKRALKGVTSLEEGPRGALSRREPLMGALAAPRASYGDVLGLLEPANPHVPWGAGTGLLGRGCGPAGIAHSFHGWLWSRQRLSRAADGRGTPPATAGEGGAPADPPTVVDVGARTSPGEPTGPTDGLDEMAGAAFAVDPAACGDYNTYGGHRSILYPRAHQPRTPAMLSSLKKIRP